MLLFQAMSEKSVILHEEITSSQADSVSVVGSARTHFAISINLHVPLKKISCGYGQGESGDPGEVLEKLVVGDQGETDEYGVREHIESENVDVVCDAPALVISRFELHGFIFSEFVRRKGLEGPTLSECVFDTARLPQCEFSNLHTSLAFGLLE